ncbi:MAG: UMP kinase, partial [Chlorobiales bacterium]|nr:UMP kinase [Chlorobiales bacterium]
EMYKNISYLDVLQNNLRVMDLTAITLCRENLLPIVVMNMNVEGNLGRLLNGEAVGTLVNQGGE